jgi:hypothetical protein
MRLHIGSATMKSKSGIWVYESSAAGDGPADPSPFELGLFIQRASPASFGAEYLLFGQVNLTEHELA